MNLFDTSEEPLYSLGMTTGLRLQRRVPWMR